jgi:hypothetical protein
MIHYLIHAGSIPDLAPHYLWNENDRLVKWCKAKLVMKLKNFLETDMRRRAEKKSLIRNIETDKPEGRRHAELIKWCSFFFLLKIIVNFPAFSQDFPTLSSEA